MNGADEDRGREGSVDAANDLLFMIVDLEGEIKALHPGWEELLDRPREKMKGRPLMEFVHPEDRAETLEAMDQLSRGDAIRGFQNRYMTRDGEPRWMEWQALLDPERDLVYGAAEDVTEKRRVEDQLREQEARYRALFERSRDAIVHADADGRIVQWNRGAEEMFGWTREEITGDPLTTIMPERYRKMHRVGMRRYQETGEERALAEDSLQVHGLRKDGSEFPIEITLGSWEHAGTSMFGAIIRDITKRLETEEELRREKRYVELLQQVAMAANEAEVLSDAFQRSLREIARTIGWPVGHVYLRDPADPARLRPTDLWYTEGGPEAFPRFRAATQGTTLERGEGLPGRVLEGNAPTWIADLPRDPGFRRARGDPGIEVVTGFGFPVRVGDEVVGVLEFYHTDPMEPDQHLLEVMDPIGTQLGRVVERVGRFQTLKSALEEERDAAERV